MGRSGTQRSRVIRSSTDSPVANAPVEPGLELVHGHKKDEPATSELAGIVNRVLVDTGASGAALALESHGKVLCCARAGTSAPTLGAELNREAGISGLCLRSGDIVRCDDAARDERVDAEAARSLGIASIVAVPVITGGKTIGLLEVFSREPNAFGIHEEGILLAAVAQVLAAVNDEAEMLAQDRMAAVVDIFDESSGAEASAAPSTMTSAENAASILSPALPPAQDTNSSARDTALEFRGFTEVEAEKPNRLLVLVVALVALLAIGAIVLSGGVFKGAPQGMNSQVQSLNRAAEQGDALAQYRLAVRYREGNGVTKNDSESVRWLKEAARQGNSDAQFDLGTAYLTGRGVEKDPVSAYACYALSGANGNGASDEAMKSLAPTLSSEQVAQVRSTVAEMYLHGRGTPQDYKAAYMWFTLAEYAGNSGSTVAKRALASKMNKAQMEAAQRGAEQWMKRHPQ